MKDCIHRMLGVSVYPVRLKGGGEYLPSKNWLMDEGKQLIPKNDYLLVFTTTMFAQNKSAQKIVCFRNEVSVPH